jgi:hypothetical protein
MHDLVIRVLYVHACDWSANILGLCQTRLFSTPDKADYLHQLRLQIDERR